MKNKKSIKVNCSNPDCNKEYIISPSHYSVIVSRNGNNYCSSLCRLKTIEERFWNKVDIKNNDFDCWEWQAGCRTKFGYGTIKYKDKHIDAHRLSWMMINNRYDLTPKDFICHRCDNPPCVNPNHLFLGNAKINAQDAYAKGRIKTPVGFQFTTENRKGLLPENAHTDNNTALIIKCIIDERKLKKEKLNLKQLSILYSIPYTTIRDISCGKSYINKNIIT